MKLLLLTSGLNDDRTSSWLVFTKFVRVMRRDLNADIDIVCFAPTWFARPSRLNEVVLKTPLRGHLCAMLFRRIAKSYTAYVCRHYARKYVGTVLRYIEENSVDKMWVYADEMLLLLIELARTRTKVPFHLTVFDDPLTSSPANEELAGVWRRVLADAASIDTPTRRLAIDLEKRSLLPPDKPTAESFVGVYRVISTPPIIRDRVRTVCLAGSIYGIDALAAFLAATQQVRKELSIEFVLYAKGPRGYLRYKRTVARVPSNSIKQRPFVREEQIVDALQEHDVLYLPMMFQQRYRQRTNTSFPSKLHNYIASGVPILFHVPKDSAVHDYASQNDLGVIVDNLEHKAILNAFVTMLERGVREQISGRVVAHARSMAANAHVRALFACLSSGGDST